MLVRGLPAFGDVSISVVSFLPQFLNPTLVKIYVSNDGVISSECCVNADERLARAQHDSVFIKGKQPFKSEVRPAEHHRKVFVTGVLSQCLNDLMAFHCFEVSLTASDFIAVIFNTSAREPLNLFCQSRTARLIAAPQFDACTTYSVGYLSAVMPTRKFLMARIPAGREGRRL